MGKFARYRRALPLTAAVIIGALCAAAYGADGEEADEVAATIINRIPAGYSFFEGIRGDLNGDGAEDDVIIIKATDKKEIVRNDHGVLVDRNRRGVMIFFKNGDDYKLVLENRRIFASENEDGGVYYAPELSVEIEKGNLYFHYAHGRYGWWRYTFRYRNSDFELIGYDESDNHGPITRSETSINFLSKKMLKKINKDPFPDEDKMESYKEVFDETWYDITVKEPIKLRKITDIDELDVTELIVSKPVKK
jgi:hypothetical protein